MSYTTQLLILCPLIFLAGFIDSVAGGGGLLSMPAFMLTGIPMHNVMATNKLSNSIGTATAALKFAKSGKIQWQSALISAVFGMLGGLSGSMIALAVDSDILKKAFTLMLPFIAVFVLFGKKSTSASLRLSGIKMLVASAFIGFIIGIYDGVIGPGSGTFLIFAYTIIIGFDYVTASGNAKITNMASLGAAAVNYLIAGKVMWDLAVPAIIMNISGSYLGASYAVKHGGKAIKKMLVMVLIGVFIKLITDIF